MLDPVDDRITSPRTIIIAVSILLLVEGAFMTTAEAILTPPVGPNLIVAMTAYRERFGLLVRAALPFIGPMLVALALIGVFPSISLHFVRQAGDPMSIARLCTPHRGLRDRSAAPGHGP